MEKYWKRIVQAKLNETYGRVECLLDDGQTFFLICEIPECIPATPEKKYEFAENYISKARLEDLYFDIEDRFDFLLPWEHTLMLLATSSDFPVYVALGQKDEIEMVFGREMNNDMYDMGEAQWLVDAAYNGNLAEVKKLIEAGVPAKTTFECATPLHWAAYNGHADVTEYLIAHGDDIDTEWELVVAMMNRYAKSIKTIITAPSFSLCCLIPHSFILDGEPVVDANMYSKTRKQAISYVMTSVERRGLTYAQKVAADIEQILNNVNRKPSKRDIKALEPLIKKLSSMDWVADARVSCDNFLQ